MRTFLRMTPEDMRHDMWLRSFCPQACYAGGRDDFRYLLCTDVNRLPKL